MWRGDRRRRHGRPHPLTDTTGGELNKLADEMSDLGVTFAVPRLEGPVRQAMPSAGVVLDGVEYPRIADAVEALSNP